MGTSFLMLVNITQHQEVPSPDGTFQCITGRTAVILIPLSSLLLCQNMERKWELELCLYHNLKTITLPPVTWSWLLENP